MNELSIRMTNLRASEERCDTHAAPGALTAKLDQAIEVLGEYLAGGSPPVTRFKSLRDRLARSEFRLAVLGQFKRGKSTFINALLGAPLLPMALVPLTAAPVFIFWQPSPLVRVRFKDARPPEEFRIVEPQAIRELLFRFVAEEANPENRLGVERVDLFYPAPILGDGTVLIDTPGVGSTFQHNTATALDVLPECDAVLFVLSADPPITEAERDYLRRLRPRAAQIFFILNKVDQLAPDERNTIVEFTGRVLEANGVCQSGSRIFSVSARNGLDAKQRGHREQLEASGIPTLESQLVRYLASEKSRLLDDAIRSKAVDILSQAIAELSLRTQALELPIQSLAAKLSAFEEALSSIEEQRRVTCDLMTGEQRRLRGELEARVESLRGEASSRIVGVIEEVTAVNPRLWDGAAQRAISRVMEQTFDGARRDLADAFAHKTNTAVSGYQRRLDALIDTVRRIAAEIFEVPFREDLETEPYGLGEEPYWVTEGIKTTLIPDASGLIGRLLPRRVSANRVRALGVIPFEEHHEIEFGMVCADVDCLAVGIGAGAD
jgi:GTPase Era involved in 16S rRNA processing